MFVSLSPLNPQSPTSANFFVPPPTFVLLRPSLCPSDSELKPLLFVAVFVPLLILIVFSPVFFPVFSPVFFPFPPPPVFCVYVCVCVRAGEVLRSLGKGRQHMAAKDRGRVGALLRRVDSPGQPTLLLLLFSVTTYYYCYHISNVIIVVLL